MFPKLLDIISSFYRNQEQQNNAQHDPNVTPHSCDTGPYYAGPYFAKTYHTAAYYY